MVLGDVQIDCLSLDHDVIKKGVSDQSHAHCLLICMSRGHTLGLAGYSSHSGLGVASVGLGQVMVGFSERCGHAGSRCSPSLVELFRGLNSVTEENQFVSGACIMYAGLMERTLGKLVMVHVAGLESLCQVSPQRSQNTLHPHRSAFRP